MAGMERTNGDRRWVQVDLPNHPVDDYQDILDNHDGGMPDSWAYNAELPIDWAPNDALGDTGPQDEITTTAWIDFQKGHAVVTLNGDMYADAPPEGLTEEAERVLLEWAGAQRRDKAPLPHEPPDHTTNATAGDVPGKT